MLPEEWVYGGWPRSGEIDIVETIGNYNYNIITTFAISGSPILYLNRIVFVGNPDLISAADNSSIGVDKMGSTLHWGPVWNNNKYDLTHATKYGYRCLAKQKTVS